MLISDLLDLHNSHRLADGHPDILGDPYLMQNNSVYRNIKKQALAIGCKYSEANINYLVLPFHSLGEILSTKTIPFVPGARLLRNIESQRAGVLTTQDLTLPESHHLHEAAHVIAEHFFKDLDVSDQQIKILKSIVCESFANSVDLMAWLPVESEEHSFFLQQNCYMHPTPRNIAVLHRLIKDMGSRFTFMFTMLAYIHANFLLENISSRLIHDLAARYAPEVSLSEKVLKDCEALMKLAEKLDPLFRIQTTQMYFKLEGLEGEIYELLNFSFMKIFETNPHFRRATESMADVILA